MNRTDIVACSYDFLFWFNDYSRLILIGYQLKILKKKIIELCEVNCTPTSDLPVWKFYFRIRKNVKDSTLLDTPCKSLFVLKQQFRSLTYLNCDGFNMNPSSMNQGGQLASKFTHVNNYLIKWKEKIMLYTGEILNWYMTMVLKYSGCLISPASLIRGNVTTSQNFNHTNPFFWEWEAVQLETWRDFFWKRVKSLT